MAGKITVLFALFAFIAFSGHFQIAAGSPAIATGYDAMEICIENCAQCKKMLGAWFEGPLCAESCIKFKGKLIPECEDFASISPFLNKL
uniref:Eclosion hormone n=1 Tax=Heortia vitessoides TaxID=1557813 RepID=A0A7D4YAV3_9NEOP|nr:eclosion hormone [Heortia vitessoides]